MIAALLAALPLHALLPVQEPSAPVPAFDPAKSVTASVLEEEIDRSLHWLRGRYDPAKGSYGSLAADARCLLAFAASPRQYRVSEGPFVSGPLARVIAAQKPDGTFGDAALDAFVIRALTALRDSSADAALERTKGGGQRAGVVVPPPQGELAGPDAAIERARTILSRRNPDGSFGAGASVVSETAERVIELSQAHAALKSAEPKKAPKDAHPLPPLAAAQRAQIDQALARGASYLLTQRVEGGFGFDGRRDAGITAMAVGALLSVPEPRPAPVQAAINEGLDWVVTLQKDDGSIHEGQLANYVTSAAVLALAKGSRPADRARIEKATAFLKALQADEGEGYSARDRFYGGVGYGGDERPDLSNLQMALEALDTAGVPESDPVFQKAIAFLQRCQNRSESNDLALVEAGVTIAAGNDGGGAYAPGDSKAGFIELPDGKRVPRSYGSMSYALLKGYLFAGLAKDDPRVQAVWKWLRENYTLDVNPGFQASDDPTAAYQGLFYYFYTMAKALDLFGEHTITDAGGKSHDWRAELAGRLLAMQRQDGSWLNENAARWYEGNPVLATSYAMLALGTTRGAP